MKWAAFRGIRMMGTPRKDKPCEYQRTATFTFCVPALTM